MACPFFAPSRRVENAGWVRPPRYPLGDLFSGTCHAIASHPAEDHQEECCNFGYARGRCDRFPGDAAPDAVRFSVTGDVPNRVALVYVVEKDHAPMEHGTLIYEISSARLESPPISEVLAGQARAFLETYVLNRTRSQQAATEETARPSHPPAVDSATA